MAQEDPLEKEMATHSSALAWRIPWTEEPGGLQSTGLRRVRADLATEQEHKEQEHEHTLQLHAPDGGCLCRFSLSGHEGWMCH